MRLFGSLVLGAAVLFGGAVRADELAVIDRPITLPAGAVEAMIRSDISNWDFDNTDALTGATLGASVDFGITSGVQLGLAVVAPIAPGAGFGSIYASAAFALGRAAALRLDAGYERFGFNGTGADQAGANSNTVFGGVGVPIKVPITSTLAFVSGSTGAMNFAHFTNVGSNGTGLYLGANTIGSEGADLISVESGNGVNGGNDNSGVAISVNLPVGLMFQPDPHFAITLRTGYSAAISLPSDSSGNEAYHFIPVGLDVVVSPVKLLDIGASFALAGYVGNTGGSADPGINYADIRAFSVWARARF